MDPAVECEDLAGDVVGRQQEADESGNLGRIVDATQHVGLGIRAHHLRIQRLSHGGGHHSRKHRIDPDIVRRKLAGPRERQAIQCCLGCSVGCLAGGARLARMATDGDPMTSPTLPGQDGQGGPGQSLGTLDIDRKNR